MFEAGGVAIGFGFYDFGFEVFDGDREFFLGGLGKLEGGLAEGRDEFEEIFGAGVVSLGECVVADSGCGVIGGDRSNVCVSEI